MINHQGNTNETHNESVLHINKVVIIRQLDHNKCWPVCEETSSLVYFW